MKPATLEQVSQLLRFVQDQSLGSSHVQALIETGCFADICEAAKRGLLGGVDRTNFRKCIGLDATDFAAYDVVVDYNHSRERMIKDGDYASVRDVTIAEDFPISGIGIHEVSVVLLHFDCTMRTDEVLTAMDKQGYRGAKIEYLFALGKLFALGETHRDDQANYQIVDLGSLRQEHNCNHVPLLCSSAGEGRTLSVAVPGIIWRANARFLAVRK